MHAPACFCPECRALATNKAATHPGDTNGERRRRGKGAMPKTRILGSGMYLPGRLVTNADLEVGGMVVPKGAYTLYTLPMKTQWKLIINRQTGQWGTEYNRGLDLARINLEKKALKAPVEKLTFALERRSNSSGLLKIEWERTSLTIPIALKSN